LTIAGLVLGSASQIALFVAPVLVLLSYVIRPRPMICNSGRARAGSSACWC
jgi:Ca2+/H+ antiporter